VANKLVSNSRESQEMGKGGYSKGTWLWVSVVTGVASLLGHTMFGMCLHESG